MSYESKHSNAIKKQFKLKEYFSISASKASVISGIAVSLALITALTLYIFPSRAAEFTDFTLGMIVNYSFPILIGLVIAFKLKFNNRVNQVVHLILFFTLPVALLVMSEALNGLLKTGFTRLAFFGGYFLILFLLFTVFAILGSFKFSFIIVSTFVFLMSVANFYIAKFRGTPFLPMDFYAARTAANVAATYDFSPDPVLIFAAFAFVFLIIFFIKLKSPKWHLAFKISSRTVSAVVSVVTVIIYTTTSFFVNFGIRPYFWSQSVSAREQGFLLNFFGNFKYMVVSQPDNYNSKDIDKYIAEIYNASDNSTISSETPNIICIMNEALSDLSIWGDFETNEDYMPFLRNMTENTVKGNLYMPVIGGGTANSEFEFLTGHSMAFLPSGSYPYQTYIKSPISSMVSTLKAQGYAVNTFHPYRASGWSRTSVYGNFGFEKFICFENMFDQKFLDYYKTYEYDPALIQSFVDKNYPEASNMFMRQYISDDYDFKCIIEDFENRNTNKPYFMFNVTMQNHGGYTISASNLTETIKATMLSKEYDDVNRYLSLVKETDNATKGLIEYFSDVKEPTIICMFGDHQPAIDNAFIDEISSETAKVTSAAAFTQKHYCTPFFIWANYDIEEKYVDALSANYLSSMVLDIANVKTTIYNEYLLKLAETLPVIDFAGYVDKDGNYYTWTDESPYLDLIENYKKIQYNNLFDQKNVDSDVFYVDGYVPKAVDLTE